MFNYQEGWVGARMAQELVKAQLQLPDASAEEALPDFPVATTFTSSCEAKDSQAKRLEKPEPFRHFQAPVN